MAARISFRYGGREIEGGIPRVTLRRLTSDGFGELAGTLPYADLRTKYGTLRTNEMWRLLHAIERTNYADPQANVGFIYTFPFELG